MKPRGEGRTHVNYLVTGGRTCGILFDVVSIAAMKQRLCSDTTKIHTRTPGTTARPSERKNKQTNKQTNKRTNKQTNKQTNEQMNKQTNKQKAKVSFQAFRKTKCNISGSSFRKSVPFSLLFFLPAGVARLPLLPPATPLSSLFLLSLLLSLSVAVTLSTSSTACLSAVGGGGRGGSALGTVTMVTWDAGGTHETSKLRTPCLYQDTRKQLSTTEYFSPR